MLYHQFQILTRYKFSPRVSADKTFQSHSVDYSKVFGTIFQLLWRVRDEEVFDGTWVTNLQWLSPTDRNCFSMANYWEIGILISVHQFASIIFYGLIKNVIIVHPKIQQTVRYDKVPELQSIPNRLIDFSCMKFCSKFRYLIIQIDDLNFEFILQ